jgi:hypothetical protein
LVRIAITGMSSRNLLLLDETWWVQMFEQWEHLDERTMRGFYDEISDDVEQRIVNAVRSGVRFEQHLHEGIGGFLGSLFKVAGLILMLLFGGGLASGMRGGAGPYGRMERERRRGGARGGARAPEPTAEEKIQLARFNPHIVYEFVEKCKTKTEEMIGGEEMEPYADRSFADLPAEMPHTAETEPAPDRGPGIDTIDYPRD